MSLWLARIVLAGILAAGWCMTARAASIEAHELASLFPGIGGALRMGDVAGQPLAVEVWAGNRLVGYAFSTHEVAASVGYGGRPLDIHVGLGLDGIVQGARLARHEEPILVIGVQPQALDLFVSAFAGLDVRQQAQPASSSRSGAPDHVAGATVSSTVMKHAVLRASRAVLQSRSSRMTDEPSIDAASFVPLGWQALIESGAVARLQLTRADLAGGAGAGPKDEPFMELFAALLTPPRIGQNLLGQRAFERLQARLPAGENAVLIAARGGHSFKGTEWRQSGVFERIQLVQGSRSFRFTASQHENVEALALADAPEMREIGIFAVVPAADFKAAQPWRIELILAGGTTGSGAASVFALDYKLPPSLLIAPPATAAPTSKEPPSPAGAAEPVLPSHARIDRTPAAAEPLTDLWVEIWQRRRIEIGVTMAMLVALTVILFSHDYLVRDVSRYRIIRLSFLALTAGFLGLYAGAQLSVVNVVTFVHAALGGFSWDQFLLDPLSFVLWSFVALALLFWGRGVFCGWLCPFGALQELLNELARKLGIRQISVPWALHERLWPIKYVAFLIILGVSFKSATQAFQIAEIEPFKTVIALKLARPAPLVAYALGLLAIGLFIERFYCRYLCPLGAGLAIPARLRLFEWLKRRPQCGRECRICATQCTVQAINPLGAIVPNECIYCLQCQANHYNAALCLPLKQRAQRRAATQRPASSPIPPRAPLASSPATETARD